MNIQVKDPVDIEVAASGLRGQYVCTKATDKAVYLESAFNYARRIGFWAPRALIKPWSDSEYRIKTVVLPTWFRPSVKQLASYGFA